MINNGCFDLLLIFKQLGHLLGFKTSSCDARKSSPPSFDLFISTFTLFVDKKNLTPFTYIQAYT